MRFFTRRNCLLHSGTANIDNERTAEVLVEVIGRFFEP